MSLLLNISGLTMEAVIGVEAVGVAGLELLNVHPENIFQIVKL